MLMGALALTGAILMLFSKKSFTGYVLFALYPMVWVLVAGVANLAARAGFLLVFNILLVAEPSLWFRLHGFDSPLRAWLQTGGLSPAAFLCVDLALLGCYAYVAWLSIRWVRRATAVSSNPSALLAGANSLN